MDLTALPDDVASLKAMVIAMQRQLVEDEVEHTVALAKERARATVLAEQIERLKQQLAELRRHRFGRKSEQLDGEIVQLELAIEELEISAGEIPAAAATTKAPAARRQPRRRPLPEHLPRDVQNHGVTDACSHCGGKVSQIGEDVSEVLE